MVSSARAAAALSVNEPIEAGPCYTWPSATFFQYRTDAGKAGTVFSIAAGSAPKVIYTFAGGSDGATPTSSLSFVGGTLYGTTAKGGTKDAGTIYSISGF